MSAVVAGNRGGDVLTPYLYLVPLGPDLESGLEEFGHPLSGSVPVRGKDGRLRLTEDMGLVFVLLPAGSFTMGAQSSDPDAPNYDPQAGVAERPPHEVSLSAFFMSKYEMTQGQWECVTGNTPSAYGPGTYGGQRSTLLNPVEFVDWWTCEQVTWRMGLSLPTEAQWEYAARAQSSTPWWPGTEPELLKSVANVADVARKRTNIDTPLEAWDDGYAVHAPIGTFDANGFGLHDVLGNVWEFCADALELDFYESTQATMLDPKNVPQEGSSRAGRGGGFSTTAVDARSSSREGFPPEFAGPYLGLRPARIVNQ